MTRPVPDEPGHRWETVPEMSAGSWVEIPVDESGPPRWLRVLAAMPPEWTGEYRWALLVGDGTDRWWIKISPRLVFRVADRGP